jgi:hypothetical protein
MPRRARFYVPPEMVEIIAEYLAFDHPPPLLNLARANRSCYVCCRGFSNSIFFHDIKVTIGVRHRIKDSVNCMIEQVSAANSFCEVRRIFIVHTPERLYEVFNGVQLWCRNKFCLVGGVRCKAFPWPQTQIRHVKLTFVIHSRL